MRALAIGDIHGCPLLLDSLLAWVEPGPDDVVVTLGDYVDRGPDSRGVLDRLIALKKQDAFPVVCLRGNHEVMMVEAHRSGREELRMWQSVGGVQTLGSYGRAPGRSGTLDDVPVEHWEFLADLDDYFETDSRIFVHAGAHGDLDMAEQGESWLFWEFLRDDMRHHSGKTIVCGHTSQKSGEVKVVRGAVCIDTFAHGGGWLTCLDAATGKYWQVDMLDRRREGWVDFR